MEPHAQAQPGPNPGPRNLTPGKRIRGNTALPTPGQGAGGGAAARKLQGFFIECIKRKGEVLGRGGLRSYLWRWPGEGENGDLSSAWCMIHFPRELQGPGRACAPAAPDSRTLRPARLFMVFYQGLCTGDKVYEKRRRLRRRAGPGAAFPH